MIGSGRLLSKGLPPLAPLVRCPLASAIVTLGAVLRRRISPPPPPRFLSGRRFASLRRRRAPRRRLHDSTHDEIPSIQSQHRPQLPT